MSHFEWISRGYTDEKLRITELLLSIIDGLPYKRQCLDIGPGNGEITAEIIPAFASATLVEPHFPDLRFAVRPEIIPQKWEDVPAARVQGRFDLVLCSHTLYYMDENSVDEQIHKMYMSLTNKGVLVLILNAPGTLLSEYQEAVFPEITDPIVNWVYSSSVVDMICKRYPKLLQRTIYSCINAIDSEMMVNLLYSLSGAGHNRDKEKIIDMTWDFVRKIGLTRDPTDPIPAVIFPLKSYAYIISTGSLE